MYVLVNWDNAFNFSSFLLWLLPFIDHDLFSLSIHVCVCVMSLPCFTYQVSLFGLVSNYYYYLLFLNIVRYQTLNTGVRLYTLEKELP